jgi:hypothetical protein
VRSDVLTLCEPRASNRRQCSLSQNLTEGRVRLETRRYPSRLVRSARHPVQGGLYAPHCEATPTRNSVGQPRLPRVTVRGCSRSRRTPRCTEPRSSGSGSRIRRAVGTRQYPASHLATSPVLPHGAIEHGPPAVARQPDASDTDPTIVSVGPRRRLHRERGILNS